jgi:hypothetical protein
MKCIITDSYESGFHVTTCISSLIFPQDRVGSEPPAVKGLAAGAHSPAVDPARFNLSNHIRGTEQDCDGIG